MLHDSVGRALCLCYNAEGSIPIVTLHPEHHTRLSHRSMGLKILNDVTTVTQLTGVVQSYHT